MRADRRKINKFEHRSILIIQSEEQINKSKGKITRDSGIPVVYHQVPQHMHNRSPRRRESERGRNNI